MSKIKPVIIVDGRESVKVKKVLSELGCKVAEEFITPADYVLSEDFAIETLIRIQREKKSSAKVIVLGCLSEINPDRLAKVFDGDSLGPRSYEMLDDIIIPKKKFKEFPRPNTLQITKSLRTTIGKVKALIISCARVRAR